jgi:hypothetical protein
LSGPIYEGQKGALRGEREKEMPQKILQPDEGTEHSEEDSR